MIEAVRDGIDASAQQLEAIALDELGAALLMDRVDTKFVLPARLVPELLAGCVGDYVALEVGGRRLSRYRTTYFDTGDLTLYRAHLAGRMPRRKVRLRTYLDTGESFLEVKVRTNSGRTLKSRVPAHSADPEAALASADAQRWLASLAGTDPWELRPIVGVDFLRLTLVARDRSERVTLDMRLDFTRGDALASFPELVIAEVKTHRQGRTRFERAMRDFGVRPEAVSKYCLGVMSVFEDAKRNAYKPLLRRIHSLAQP